MPSAEKEFKERSSFMTRTLLPNPNTQPGVDTTESMVITPVISDPGAIRQFRKRGVLGLGESYMDGLWEIDRLDEFLARVFTSPSERMPLSSFARILLSSLLPRLFDRQAGLGAFKIGREHYDLGNDLFRVMLDQSMSYTSGYWAEAEDLDAAQEAKLELMCRKLDLRPGMRVLDIGCGWGNFAHHAASDHGVHVTGITVSSEQAEVASSRCLDLPVDIRIQDYRDLSEQFDRIVSIEMIEAVGRRNVPRFFKAINHCLADGGLFGLQVISGDMLSRTSNRRMDQFVLWLLKYIFPDGYLPLPRELAELRGTQLQIEDWHRFSADYDRTLMSWAERLNNGWDELGDLYGDRFRRQWDFYLHGCAAAFRSGLIDVQQIIYSKHGRNTRYRSVR
jgi:cyclopropane-fatty-acyl-phospholipid synthase